jgi:hypothetical protein
MLSNGKNAANGADCEKGQGYKWEYGFMLCSSCACINIVVKEGINVIRMISPVQKVRDINGNMDLCSAAAVHVLIL